MAKDKATLNIDPELHRKLKVEAAMQGEKISEFAERLLKEGLSKPAKRLRGETGAKSSQP